jgi:hypothetical protein
MIKFYLKTLKVQIAVDIYVALVFVLTAYLYLRTGSGDYSKLLYYLTIISIMLLLCSFILQIITVTFALLAENWKLAFRIFFHLFLILFLLYVSVNVFKIVTDGGDAI